MSWLDRFWPSSRKSMTSLDLFREIYGGRITKSGKVVNYKTALEVSTVLACARVIANGLSQVPLKIFLDNGKTKLPATDHPLYRLLHLKPNEFQTSFEFLETLGLHVVLTGTALCFKNRLRGQVRELLPMIPGTYRQRVAPDWTITWDVNMAGETMTLAADDVWHIKGPSWAPWSGLDATHLARDAIGLAIATEESHASMHRDGLRTTGTYSVEGTLTPEQYKALADHLKKNMGSENAGRPLILDRSAKWLSDQINGVDAQHLETRRYQVEDICRSFGVLPIMVGAESKNSTYASAEQMFLAHVVHTLMPWYRRFEQSINANLLGEKDFDAGYYAKFIEQGLLRGSMVDTSDYLKGLVGLGIITRNEARALLEFNPLDGLDDPLTPVNLGIGPDPNDPNDPADDATAKPATGA